MHDFDPGAFMTSVRANPGAIEPRLVYADWLEESGDLPQARFVRLQCEAAELPRGPRRQALACEADQLRLDHEEEWLGPWADVLVRWRWERGLIHEATLTADAFLEHGARLFEEHLVDRIGFVEADGDPLTADAVAAVVDHPSFVHVRSLDLLGATPVRGGHFPWRAPPIPFAAWLRALAHDERLTEFRETLVPARTITLGGLPHDDAAVDPRDLEAFCKAPQLAKLRTLDLRGCRLPRQEHRDQLASRIAEAPFARTLRRLSLSKLTVEAVRRIARDPVFKRLRRLDIDGVTSAGRRELFTSTTLQSLSHVAIDETELDAYVDSPLCKRVTSLEVAGDSGGASAASWRRLFETARPPVDLTLFCCDPGLEVLNDLRQSPWLRRVRSLTIRNDSQSFGLFHDEAIAELLVSGSLPRLTHLRLHELATPELVDALGPWPGLAALETLELTDDYHGRCPANLLGSPNLGPNLRTMNGVVIESANDVDTIHTGAAGLLQEVALGFVVNLAPSAVRRLFASDAMRPVQTLWLTFAHGVEMQPLVFHTLANPDVLPRLQTVVTSDDDELGGLEALRERLGPRLKR